MVFPKKSGHLLICTSDAMKPKLGTIDGKTLIDIEEARTIIGVCSQYENINTTGVFVGNHRLSTVNAYACIKPILQNLGIQTIFRPFIPESVLVFLWKIILYTAHHSFKTGKKYIKRFGHQSMIPVG